MKQHLDEKEFEQLRQRLSDGEARIIVSKSVARQFFLRVSNESILETAGESLGIQKTVIWTTLAAGILLMLVTLASVIFYSGWTAAILVPLIGSFWTVVAGFTSHLGTWKHSIAAIVCAVVLALLLPESWAVTLMMLAISLVLLRFANALAQHWLTALLSKSFPAYDMMTPHITLEHPDKPQ